MNLIEELERIEFGFNDNQKSFFCKCRCVFEKIDESKIGKNSTVLFENGTLEIKLIHIVDPDTSIIFKIDKYEIYIISAEMGDSMFYQFPKSKGDNFYNQVREYVRAVLNGDYIKELCSNQKGRYVKSVVKWRNGKYREATFMSLGCNKEPFF